MLVICLRYLEKKRKPQRINTFFYKIVIRNLGSNITLRVLGILMATASVHGKCYNFIDDLTLSNWIEHFTRFGRNTCYIYLAEIPGKTLARNPW